MTIDSKYFVLPPLQQVLFDKLDGSLLAGGIVTFYKDSARTELKDIFQIDGVPPDYGYSVLPNPLTLSSIGSYVDQSGNNIIPLLYPYDVDTGEVELYYIDVKSSDGREQFTVEGWPYVVASASTINGVDNLVPNGQFLLHNYISSDGKLDNSPVVNIAYGGWTFERPTGTTSIDIITFYRWQSYVTIPSQSPRFGANIVAQVPGSGDLYKRLCLTFNDVNKFAGETLTYSFYAQASGVPFQVFVSVLKHFGTNGSPDVITTYAPLDITTQGDYYNTTMEIQDNIGKTIGLNDDDYIQIIIAFPASYPFSVVITDVSLLRGNYTLDSYPPETEAQNIYKSLGGGFPIPNPDGSDLYLPVVLSKAGLAYDHSIIGKVFSSISSVLGAGELPMDGTAYKTKDYSTDGIPYSRLQKILWNEACQTPIGGTGKDFMTAVFANTPLASGNGFIITNNSAASVADTADGAIPTGFNFSTIHTGSATGYYVYTYVAPIQASATVTPTMNSFNIESLEEGDGTIDAGTSGFTVLDNLLSHDGFNPPVRNIMSVTTIAATGLAGKYFYFTTTHIEPVHHPVIENYYVWFKVDGLGDDPIPGGTGILVNLLSGDTDVVVAIKIAQALNGWQNSLIKTIAASAITGGSYFTTHLASGQQYVIWYKKDGVGTDPAIAGSISIEVDIVSTDTNVLVASKTQRAINSIYYAIPDFRGLFLRSTGGSQNQWDILANSRYSVIPGYYGDVPATYELDMLLAHNHQYSQYVFITRGVGGGGDTPYATQTTTSPYTSVRGSYENRPVSAAVNYIIKY